MNWGKQKFKKLKNNFMNNYNIIDDCFENLVSLLESGTELNIKLADNLLQNGDYHFAYEFRYNDKYQNLSVTYDFMRNIGVTDFKISNLVSNSVLTLDILAGAYFDVYFLLENRPTQKHFLFDNDRKRQPKSWYILKNMVEKQLEPTNENMKDFDIIINKEAIKKNWNYIKTRKIT